MVHLIPGDAALTIAGERATEEVLTQIREDIGLDKPLYYQYGIFLWDLVRLDLGRSSKTKQLIVDEIKRYFPATAELTLAAMVFSIIFGIMAGIIAAVYRGKFFGLFLNVYIARGYLYADFLAWIDAHFAFLPLLEDIACDRTFRYYFEFRY